MSEEEQEGKTVEDVFNELDEDKDGRINADQLLILLPQCLEIQDLDKAACDNLISQVENKDGAIDYENFMNLLNALQNPQNEGEEEEEEEEQINIGENDINVSKTNFSYF